MPESFSGEGTRRYLLGGDTKAFDMDTEKIPGTDI
jgi:hypothetical protein